MPNTELILPSQQQYLNVQDRLLADCTSMFCTHYNYSMMSVFLIAKFIMPCLIFSAYDHTHVFFLMRASFLLFILQGRLWRVF